MYLDIIESYGFKNELFEGELIGGFIVPLRV
jgi:hypothetical protein